MYIEAVTVCVHYSDFLAHSLPLNKVHFDHYVVITSRDDVETQRLCMHHNVECLITDRFTEGGQFFNKAKGINEGLLYQSKRDWMVHIDADIVLPAQFRSIVEKMDLDKNGIYGCDRLMCPDFQSWINHVKKPKSIYDKWIYIHLDAFPVASRVADYNGNGYAPIGFFQMWHPQTSQKLIYPEEHGAADRTDMMFSKQWPRKYRHLLPELVVVHLDSENATVKQMGKNWLGRKTIPFGYEQVPVKKRRYFSKLLWILAILAISAGFAFAIDLYYKLL
jgi:hypothetical protein